MSESRKYILYALGIFAAYAVLMYIAGFFKIGLLSDDYLNIYDALNSDLYQKFTGNLPFTNAFHIRPVYYLSLEKSIAVNNILGLEPGNFIWFRIQNLMLLYFISFTAGIFLLYLTGRTSVSAAGILSVLIYSNNINNICWMAARVDLICGFFYLISFLLFIIYSDSGKRLFFILSVLTFITALLTKELAITLPLTVAAFEYFRKGFSGLKKALPLLTVLLIILAVYFIFRIIILGNDVADITTLYQSFPLSNAPGVYARALIALTIPLDFITINFQLRNDNKLILIYLIILYGSIFYLIWTSYKTEIYRIAIQLVLLFFLLITPYAVVGYIRPQMILLPFTVITVFILYLYGTKLRESKKLKKEYLRISFAAAMLIWGYWSYTTVNDWHTAYEKAKVNAENLVKLPKEEDKKIVIIGNPGRYKQAFMFDKMTGAYGYFKYGDFIIKDTINDVIQSAAFQESSIGAKFTLKEISPTEFEIKAEAPKQFFYIEGYNPERIRTGFFNEDISVEFTEFNTVDKPIRLTLKILNKNINCYLAEELGFRKIN
ncbi:MAG: hypothetical protein UZ05_CHB002001888 [Chlorobi bacterium OLB5]|nr:MAG: hypothetical protein UZ05_CHB002001888 [Chlorobi bacterium OLB5]